MALLVAVFLICRLLRIADGIEMRYFWRNFTIVADGPLIPELGRLMLSTVAWWKLVLVPLVVIPAVALLGTLVARALRHAQAYLTAPRGQAFFAGIAGVFLVLSWFAPPVPQLKNHHLDYRLGAFSTSMVARWSQEVDFALHVLGYRDERLHPVKESTARLLREPITFGRLGKANVFLFFIESYGMTVVRDPRQLAVVGPVWDRVEKSLAEAGYGVRSGQLVSPTYGGRSWLAHTTMAVGAKVNDQLLHRLVLKYKAKTMASAFNDAGYRTVHVAPGTTREDENEKFYGFQTSYIATSFDYKGPKFSWATMPDQFVVDFIHRKEIAHPTQPLYVEYVLVSSHAPFDIQPPFIDDWSRVGDGSIYQQVPAVKYPHLTWTNLQEAPDAYTRSLAYDFDVLSQYLTRYVHDGSLVILLGDHQPAPEITGNDPNFTVPIHVLSRNKELLAPFERRGYATGMHPSSAEPRPMETFVHDLVGDFN